MKYHLLAVVSMILFATYPTLSKTLVQENHPLMIVAISGVVSGLFVAFIFGLKTEIRNLVRAKKVDGWLLLLALLSGVIAPTLYLRGLEHSSVVNATLFLSFSVPVTAVLARVFLREKLRPVHGLGLAFLLVGMGIYSTEAFQTPVHFSINDLFFLGAGLAFAFCDIIYKKYLQHIPHELVVFIRTLFGGIFILVLIPALSLEIPLRLTVDVKTIIIFGLLVMLPILFAQGLWYKALEHLRVRDAAFIGALYPIFSGVIAFLVLKETLTSFQLLGALVVVAGAFVSQTRHIRLLIDADGHEEKRHLKLRGLQH